MKTPLPAPPRVVLHAVAPPRVRIAVTEVPQGWRWTAQDRNRGFDTAGVAGRADLASLEALHVSISAHLESPRLLVVLVGGDELDAAARFAAEHLRRVHISRERPSADNYADERAVAIANSRRGDVEIATDASMPLKVPYGDAGWAWVSDDGRFRTGFTQRVSIAAAELWAIATAARDHRFADSVRIVSDSMDAVRIARRILAGEPVPPHFAGVHPERVVGAARRLSACQGTVSVDWVRGHDGHGMNEIADRLAKRARWAASAQQIPLDRTA